MVQFSDTNALIGRLSALGEGLARTTTPAEALEALVTGARGLLPFTATALALAGAGGWRVWRAAASRPSEVSFNAEIPEPAVQTLERFLSHGAPLYIADLLGPPWSESSHREVLWKDGTRSAMLVPLVAGGATIGALSFTSTRPDQYSSSGNEIAVFLAWMVATSLRVMPAVDYTPDEAEPQ
jgi:transcriptional regulator with GAF, ATPase, and Fis domain